jgi:hypothetical protein
MPCKAQGNKRARGTGGKDARAPCIARPSLSLRAIRLIPALRHGGFTAEMKAIRKEIIALARIVRETMAAIEG